MQIRQEILEYIDVPLSDMVRDFTKGVRVIEKIEADMIGKKFPTLLLEIRQHILGEATPNLICQA
ncbi:hypothetical protein D3C85_1715260 [compost metagenome]